MYKKQAPQNRWRAGIMSDLMMLQRLAIKPCRLQAAPGGLKSGTKWRL